MQKLFTESSGGELTVMRPSAPPTEDMLQSLIERHPELISRTDGKLLLIKRELGVPGEDDGGNRWSIDHLFVTPDAVPILVEVKRAVDTRLRREVVGQLLDYAANGVSYWPGGSLRAAFEERFLASDVDPAEVVADFSSDSTVDGFWDQVDANLTAGRVELYVVADRIPVELATVIEFLNEQMRAEVRAIELQYFESEDGRRTVAPRVIGETQRSSTKSPNARRRSDSRQTIDEWIEAYIEPAGRDKVLAAKRFVELMESLGATTSVASTGGSIVALLHTPDGKRPVVPFNFYKDAHVWVNFSSAKRRPKLQSPAIRRKILSDLKEIVGSVGSGNIDGYPAFKSEEILDNKTFKEFQSFSKNYFDLLSESEQ